jgi:histidine ammonia-lyase
VYGFRTNSATDPGAASPGCGGLSLTDAAVESRATAALSLDDRRLQLEDQPYPVRITDVAALKRRLSAAAARVGRAEGAKGAGNSTKRLRLWLTGAEVTAEELAARLEGPM